MKYFATAAALVSAVPCIVSLTINTPTSVVQCQPQLLSWTDGAPPYYLAILPGGQPSAAPLKSFDTQPGNSITWTVDIAGGTSVTFSLKDSTGATAYTDSVSIQPGSDSSCLNGNTQAAVAPGSAGPSENSNSAVIANSASPSAAVAQASDAPGSTVSGSAGTTRVGVSGAGVAATTARANASAAPPAATQSRVVATAGTTSAAARPSSSSTSGAKSLFTGSGLGFAGFIGLAGAFFL